MPVASLSYHMDEYMVTALADALRESRPPDQAVPGATWTQWLADVHAIGALMNPLHAEWFVRQCTTGQKPFTGTVENVSGRRGRALLHDYVTRGCVCTQGNEGRRQFIWHRTDCPVHGSKSRQ